MPKPKAAKRLPPPAFGLWYSRLDGIRAKRGLSWRDLAEVAGIQSSRWTTIGQEFKKRGEATEGLGVGALARIAYELNISLNYLVLGVGSEPLHPYPKGYASEPELGDFVGKREEQEGEPRRTADVGKRAPRTQGKR